MNLFSHAARGNSWKIHALLIAVTLAVLPARADADLDRLVHQVTYEVYDVAFPKKTVKLGDVLVEDSLKPFLRIEVDASRNHQVVFSEAFLQTLGNMAEARAIENQRPGFLSQYAKALLVQNPGDTVESLVGFEGSIPDREKLQNEQTSYFSQMLAVYVGAEIVRFQDQLAGKTSGKGTDWESVLARGMKLALDGGYASDGILAAIECIDKMEVRPEWSWSLCPKNTSFGSMRKRLQNLEREFFSGKLD